MDYRSFFYIRNGDHWEQINDLISAKPAKYREGALDLIVTDDPESKALCILKGSMINGESVSLRVVDDESEVEVPAFVVRYAPESLKHAHDTAHIELVLSGQVTTRQI